MERCTLHLPHTSYIHAKVHIGKILWTARTILLEYDNERCLIGPFPYDGIIGNDVAYEFIAIRSQYSRTLSLISGQAQILAIILKIGDFVEIKTQ